MICLEIHEQPAQEYFAYPVSINKYDFHENADPQIHKNMFNFVCLWISLATMCKSNIQLKTMWSLTSVYLHMLHHD